MGVASPGGSVSRLSAQIYREAAYIAYHFGWGRKEVLEMSHRERQRWLREIGRINEEVNAASRRRGEALLKSREERLEAGRM
ncbi:DUF6760 family protein [Sediminispirochaeta bajacaliforniensis]|uniref:DUF6760 family protein n=1 Tax=Sediminispirochaeta bajacaliforniensis TaxID=148 RepID=UPI000362C0B4|nr:DUF6760 family protein [Sediminispirochaeta bajacaliforniensis]